MKLLFIICLTHTTVALLINVAIPLRQNLFGIANKWKIQPTGDPPARIEELDLPDSKQRLIVIGDVHGNLSPFNELLEKLNYNSSHDHLVLTGDIIGKGPQSIEVLKKAKEVKAGCVRGNHDNLLIEWRQFLQQLSSSADKNPFPTDLKPKSPYYPLARKLDSELYEYLTSCPIILSVPRYSLYILHAGVDPTRPMVEQDATVVMNVKNLLADGTPTRHNKLGKHWSDLWNLKQEAIGENATTIVYGHQASRGLNIKPYSIGLDTGCVYGRQLTAMVFPGNELFSVNCDKHARKPFSYLPIFEDFF
ncbi:hypothetical protein K7432_004021 [Basidiobolus ranarum]|uniref:Calcineurin-like phosphoesterase domain-containing protein n=1 Tax=Basidiobolus ranarum TaxID=34480 RepID=A0ABR2WYX3_9FUNG